MLAVSTHLRKLTSVLINKIYKTNDFYNAILIANIPFILQGSLVSESVVLIHRETIIRTG